MKLRSNVQPSNDISHHLQARSGCLAAVATLVSGAVLGLVGGVGIEVDGILGAAAVAAVHIATAFSTGLSFDVVAVLQVAGLDGIDRASPSSDGD